MSHPRKKRGRKRVILSIIQIAVVLIIFPAFFAAVSFYNAYTPQEALARYGSPLPEGWPAGVNNHGSYYKWWTNEQKPVLSALSVVTVVVGVLFLIASALACNPKNREDSNIGES